MAIIVRDFNLDEEEIVAEFFHTQWRDNHIFYRNRELLLWQYHGNPYAKQFTDGLTFKAAFDATELVGVFGYIPFVFNRYGSREYGCHLSAWWVHPNYRRGPTGVRLLHELQYRMSFSACIAGINTPIAERLYERMGWVVVRNISRVIAPLNETCVLDLMASGEPHVLELARERLASRRPQERRVTAADVRVGELSSLGQLAEMDWDNFYWRRAARSHMGPSRELAYLLWRYRDIPVYRYRALAARKDGEVAGLAVFRVEQVRDRDEKVVRLVDLLGEESVVKTLVWEVLESARQDRAVMVDFFCTNRAHFSSLHDCGFVDASDLNGEQYWFPHLFQPLDTTHMRLNTSWWIRGMNLSADSARQDFVIMKGDYEFDRPN